MSDKTILVADDQQHVMQVVRLSLERVGYQVHAVTSGEEALRAAETTRFDLLVIDVDMPVVGGFEVIRRLNQMPAYVALPVIIITGSGDNKVRQEAEQLGVVAFLTKPFSPNELQRRVQNLLEL
jgi:CheY-like chemotaxis protein